MLYLPSPPLWETLSPVQNRVVFPEIPTFWEIFVEGDKVGKLKEILGEFSRKVKPFKAFALREVEVI